MAASIQTLEGISAHADVNQLIDWISQMQSLPKKVYVNHGADSVCDAFAATVTERLGIEASAPYSGDSFDPVSGAQLAIGSRKKAVHGNYLRKHRASAVWTKLHSAGMRLIGIIERSRNCSSKDLAALTNRIHALCDKQEKEIKKK